MTEILMRDVATESEVEHMSESPTTWCVDEPLC